METGESTEVRSRLYTPRSIYLETKERRGACTVQKNRPQNVYDKDNDLPRRRWTPEGGRPWWEETTPEWCPERRQNREWCRLSSNGRRTQGSDPHRVPATPRRYRYVPVCQTGFFHESFPNNLINVKRSVTGGRPLVATLVPDPRPPSGAPRPSPPARGRRGPVGSTRVGPVVGGRRPGREGPSFVLELPSSTGQGPRSTPRDPSSRPHKWSNHGRV